MATILSQIVEVCVFKREKSKVQYLLLQRAAGEKLYPNIWQIVTGRIKQNETAVEAALRELQEETGLPVKRFWVAPVVDSYVDIEKDAVQLAPVFAAEVGAQHKVHLSSEHEHSEWLTYSAARKRIVWPGQKHALEIVHEYIAGGKEAAGLLEIKKPYLERMSL